MLDKDGPDPSEQLRTFQRIGPANCFYPGPTGGLSSCWLAIELRPWGLIRYSGLAKAAGAPVNNCIPRVATWLCEALRLVPAELRLVQQMGGRHLRRVLLRGGPDGFHSAEWRSLATGQDLGLLAPSLREDSSC